MKAPLAMRNDVLLALLLAYAAASFLHHVHNAEYLADYPNMPAWLTPAGVYGAWFAQAAVGMIGYLLVRWHHRLVGLVVLAVYAVFGLYGLAHYVIAPISSHSWTMNLTICLEVATAVLLLTAVAISLLTHARRPS